MTYVLSGCKSLYLEFKCNTYLKEKGINVMHIQKHTILIDNSVIDDLRRSLTGMVNYWSYNFSLSVEMGFPIVLVKSRSVVTSKVNLL